MLTGTAFKRQKLAQVRNRIAGLALALGLSLTGAALAQPPNTPQIPVGPPPAPSPKLVPDTRPQVSVAGQLLLLRAEKVTRKGNKTIASGNVKAEVAGVKLDCQQLEYDADTKMVKARNECLFYWGDNYAAAEAIDMDIVGRTAEMRRVAGRGGDLVQNNNRVESPLFFWADKVVWKQDMIHLQKALLTTCDEIPGDWHYTLESDTVDIFPRDRLEASNTAITLGDTRLYTLPTLILSLDPNNRRTPEFVPRPGYNSLTGGYIRNTINYLFDKNNFGRIHVDYFTKTGPAGGIEHQFSLGDRGGGKIYYYGQQGVNGSVGRVDLRGGVGYALDEYTNLGASYSQNQVNLPGIVTPLTIGTSFGISRYEPGSAFQASYNFSRFGDNANSNYRLFYEADLTESLTGQIQADYVLARNQSLRTQRFHYLGQLTDRGDLFDTQLAVENTNASSSGGTSTYFMNRNPELRIQTHPVYLGPVPILASAGFGNLMESPSMYQTTRYDFRVQIPDQSIELPLGKFQYGAGLRQLTYGNGEAQYIMLGRAGWMENLGDFAVGRVDFNWQQPKGYTPFQHDLEFPYETLTGGLEIHQSDFWALSCQAGYDMKYHIPQGLIARLDIKPTPGWVLSASSNYDPTTSIWRTVDSQIQFKLTDSLSVTQWNVYDLVNRRITYEDFVINLEDHDWIASVAYRGVQQEVFFQFSLKAFPTAQPQVGPALYTPVLPQNLPNAFVR